MSRQIRIGIYYEIGAGWPVGGFLLSKGWQQVDKPQVIIPEILEAFSDIDFFNGYFVETVPAQVSNLTEHFSGTPNAHVIQSAVSGGVGIQRVKVAHKRMANLEATQVWDMCQSLPVDEVTSFYVTCLDLNTLIRNMQAYPDYLRIDIEGAEIVALCAYDFNPRPRVIVVDTHHQNDDAVRNILTQKGYRCFTHPAVPEDVVGILC